MQEVIDEVRNQLSSTWRFRWHALVAAWAVCIGGWYWASSQADVYEARARVYVDTTSELRNILGQQIVESNVQAQLNYVRESMLGSVQLERVARATDLHLDVHTPLEMQRLIDNLRKHIDITIGGGARNQAAQQRNQNIYTITYQHHDREKAVEVVNTLLNTFVEDTLGGRRTSSETARHFLRQQIREYEQRLSQAESRLADFQRRNFDRLPGMQGGYFSRLQSEIQNLEEASKELRLAQSRREQIMQQLRGESPRMGAGGPVDPNSIEGRIREHQARLDELLLRYTDRHPDVQAVRETLEQLEARRDMQFDAAVPGLTPSDNPVYQALMIAKNEADAEVATRAADLADREQRVERLRGLIDEMPTVEAELARLNRDYDVIHSQYQSLLSSLERERLSREATETEQVEFRVIDPPVASSQPVAPNRALLVLMVLAAGAGAGGGVAFMLSQIWPVFHGTSTLQAMTGLPVIGAVSRRWTPEDRRRRFVAVTSFVLACLGLGVIFAGVFVVEVFGPGFRHLI
jgi:polysaccharide chain length determinant protein (PEP-CTERM system associated)